MIVCPDCGFENIEGVDLCEGCGQPLTSLSLRVPTSSVEAALLKDRIEKLPPQPALSVSPDATIREVLNKMVERKVGCVIVKAADTIVGIFSERDALMRLNIDAASYAEKPVSEFMTHNPVTLESRDKIAFALQKMNQGGYRHIPVLKNGKLDSVISVRDILGYLTRLSSVATEA